MAQSDPEVDLDADDLFRQANAYEGVKSGVRGRAQQVANRARAIDRRENKGRATISIEEEVLPNGRYVCRVVTDDVSGEHGDLRTRRRATLRRAAGGT